MADAHPPPAPPEAAALRVCPDCGGLLEATEPTWTAAVDMAAETRRPDPAPRRWRCLICGYRA